MFKQIDFHLKGIVPLIVNNGQMADPSHPFAKEIKGIRAAKKRSESLTEEQSERIKYLEFMGSLYLNGTNRPILPGEGIEAAFRSFAKKTKKGKQAQYAVVCDQDPPIIYDGPKDPENLFKDKKFVLSKLVKIQGSRVMCTRAYFQEWEIKFTLNYMPDVFDRNEIIKIMQTGGESVGMFDWRPKYGRFIVVSPKIKETK